MYSSGKVSRVSPSEPLRDEARYGVRLAPYLQEVLGGIMAVPDALVIPRPGGIAEQRFENARRFFHLPGHGQRPRQIKARFGAFRRTASRGQSQAIRNRRGGVIFLHELLRLALLQVLREFRRAGRGLNLPRQNHPITPNQCSGKDNRGIARSLAVW